MRLSQLPRRTKGRDIDLRSIHVTGAWTCCCTVALDRSFRRNPRKSVLHGSVPTSHFLPSDERRGSWGPSFPPPPTSFFLLIQVTESRAKILGGRHRGGVPPVVCPARPYPQIRRLFDTGESQNHPRPRTPGEAKPSGYPYDSASRLRRGTGDRGFRRPGGGNDRSSLPGRSRCDPLKGSKPCWERNIPPFPPADRRSTTHQDLPRGDPSRTTIPEERRGQLGGILCGEWHTRAGEWTDGEARHQNVCDACQHEPHKRARKEARHTSVSA